MVAVKQIQTRIDRKTT